MARILFPSNSQWYDELKAVGYYSETELERWIQNNAASIFPHHYMIPFKKEVTITSKGVSEEKKPDLALFSHDFSQWFIVEVELEDHSLEHVLDQTRVFLNGDYNLPAIEQYIRKQFQKFHKKVKLNRLKNLLETQAPSVMVIADRHAVDWKRELARLNIKFCILEIYKNVQGRYIFRIHGDYPTVYMKEAHCRPHASYPNLIQVIGNFKFKEAGNGKPIEVIFEECLTKWNLIKIQGKQHLRLVGASNPLSPNETYGLSIDKSNKYYFKRS